MSGVSLRLFAALCVSVLAGCGSGGRPETVPVAGVVTMDGRPVEGATVAFFPDGGGQPGRGVTDASGKFKLMTFRAADGALPGLHRVSVMKAEAPVQVVGERSDTPFGNESANDVKQLLPIAYASPSTSPLSVEVKKRIGPVTLELKSGL